tara:strand:+ start:4931 stop:5404 length:474 start_codon:yes stop_codon:yes gene_type:complete
MVRYADKFMALNNKNKAAITIGMLVGAAAVVYLLMKLVAMLRKETSFKGPPSKIPVMTRRMPVMESSMARTHRRMHEPSMARTRRRTGKGSMLTQGTFNMMKGPYGKPAPPRRRPPQQGPIGPPGVPRGPPPCAIQAGEIDNPRWGQPGQRKCIKIK